MSSKKDENKQRRLILQLIRLQTPKEYEVHAEAFSQTATSVGLSPVTINSVFTFASREKDAYGIHTLQNLEFDGVYYDVKGISVTGKQFNKLAVKFKNSENQEIYLGWDTASKLFQAIKNSDLMEIPKIPELGQKVEESELEKEVNKQDLTLSIQDIYADKEKLKEVRSINQKRQIQAIIGLEDAISKVEKFSREKFKELLLEKEFFQENAEKYLEVFLPRNGLVKRIQTQKQVPENVGYSLRMVTRFKNYMSPKQYAEHIHTLRTWDLLTTPLEAKGYLKGYLSDLKELAKKDKIKGDPKKLILAMQKLYENKKLMTFPEILPFLLLYDHKKEREQVYKRELSKSNEYKKDFENGINLLQAHFIKGNEWCGGRDESVPQRISQALEGKVKSRGDQKLKEAQKWFRSKYSNKEFIHTKSFEEIIREIESIVVIARRNGIVSDTQRPAELFKEEQGLDLQEFIDKVEDVIHETSDIYAQYSRFSNQIKELAKNNIWDEKDFEFEKSQELIQKLRPYIKYTDELKQKVQTYYDLIQKSHITKDHVTIFYLERGKKYVHPDVKEVLLELANKQAVIEKKYLEIQEKTNNIIQNNPLIIKEQQELLRAPLTQEYKVAIIGTTYKQRNDFNKDIRVNFQNMYWKDKQWVLTTNKAGIGDLLETIQKYNDVRKRNLTLQILR